MTNKTRLVNHIILNAPRFIVYLSKFEFTSSRTKLLQFFRHFRVSELAHDDNNFCLIKNTCCVNDFTG